MPDPKLSQGEILRYDATADRRRFDVPLDRIAGPYLEHLTADELPGPADFPPNVTDFGTHPLAWQAFIDPCPEHDRACGPYCDVLWGKVPASEKPTESMSRRAIDIPRAVPRLRVVGDRDG
jgi:hypothetical protein